MNNKEIIGIIDMLIKSADKNSIYYEDISKLLDKKELTSAQYELILSSLKQKGFKIIAREEKKDNREDKTVFISDEQYALYHSMKNGDKKAREKLISLNLPLVKKIAAGFVNRGLSYEDLVQEGSVGLIRAVDRFDISRNVCFSTFAGGYIKYYIQKALNRENNRFGYPDDKIIAFGKMKEAERILKERGVKDISREKLSYAFNIDPDEVEMYLTIGRMPVSLDEKKDPSREDSLLILDTLIDEEIIHDPLRALEEKERREEIRICVDKAIEGLKDTEKAVITIRYGLGSDREAKSVESTAKILNLSKNSIRYNTLKAKHKIRCKVSGIADDILWGE